MVTTDSAGSECAVQFLQAVLQGASLHAGRNGGVPHAINTGRPVHTTTDRAISG